MKSTPALDRPNPDLLAMIPRGMKRIIDVGCSKGQLAKAYLADNNDCEYFGIEIDPDYAEAARKHCAKVICGDIESLPDDQFASLFPSDCWIFGDSLEHLRDPWAVLRRIRPHLSAGSQIIACIPNAQHWSVQTRLSSGLLRYENSGLLDRTHLRWFTRITMVELFRSTGYKIVQGKPRILNEPKRNQTLPAIAALAEAAGADPKTATNDAIVFQWLFRAVPA
jgi:SAM-dependent methyltransferase